MTPESRPTDDNTNSSQHFRPGTRPPFFYKSGPDWPNVNLEAHPAVVPQPLRDNWDLVAKRVYERLDSCNVRWRSIDPLAFGNEGEAKPFCPFIISVGVTPNTLLYEDAVRAADAVKEVLTDAGCPEVEVAFSEVRYWGSMAALDYLAEVEKKKKDGGSNHDV